MPVKPGWIRQSSVYGLPAKLYIHTILTTNKLLEKYEIPNYSRGYFDFLFDHAA